VKGKYRLSWHSREERGQGGKRKKIGRIEKKKSTHYSGEKKKDGRNDDDKEPCEIHKKMKIIGGYTAPKKLVLKS